VRRSGRIWYLGVGRCDSSALHFQTVDPKGRIVLPARFKRLLSPSDQDTMVLTAGRERCLLLYPLTEWARLAEILDGLPKSEAKRDAIRTISDNTTELELDANGPSDRAA
jgi:MraZ protein